MTPITAKPQPTGTRTIHLKDVPLDRRLNALHQLMRQHAIPIEEAAHLLAIALDPGDRGGRIAA